VHKIRLRPGLRPGHHWGSLQRSLRPSSWLRGPTSLGREREGRGERERRRRDEGDGRDHPLPFENS